MAEKVRLVLNEYPKLRLTQGRKVLEIRPTIKWDKGKALEFLLESLGKCSTTSLVSTHSCKIIIALTKNYIMMCTN